MTRNKFWNFKPWLKLWMICLGFALSPSLGDLLLWPKLLWIDGLLSLIGSYFRLLIYSDFLDNCFLSVIIHFDLILFHCIRDLSQHLYDTKGGFFAIAMIGLHSFIFGGLPTCFNSTCSSLSNYQTFSILSSAILWWESSFLQTAEPYLKCRPTLHETPSELGLSSYDVRYWPTLLVQSPTIPSYWCILMVFPNQSPLLSLSLPPPHLRSGRKPNRR